MKTKQIFLTCLLFFLWGVRGFAATYQTIEWEQTLTRDVGDTVVLTAKATSGLPIRYTSSDTLVAIIVNDSVLVVVGAGSTEITASQPGDNNYNPALKVVRTFAVVGDPGLKPQSILWNQTLAYTLDDRWATLTAEATSGLPVIYTSSNINVAMIIGNKLIFMDAGQAIITAIQSGNDEYNPATVEQLILTVGDPDKQSQTILWEQTLNTTYNGNNLGAPHYISLNATAGSGLGIVYHSSNTDIAVIVNREVMIVGPGQAIITATQEGDQRYNPAPAVQQVITVLGPNKWDQTIDWEQTLESSDADNLNTIVLDATASSGLPTRYISSNTKVATIKDNVLTVEGRGLAIITATQQGNDKYNPAPVVKRVFATTSAVDAYSFDSCVTTMHCNFFRLNLQTLHRTLNADNAAQGIDTVIILYARWFLDDAELIYGVSPAGEFLAGYSYLAGDSETAYLASGVYHFVLRVRKVKSDGSIKDLDIRSGNRTVSDCSEAPAADTPAPDVPVVDTPAPNVPAPDVPAPDASTAVTTGTTASLRIYPNPTTDIVRIDGLENIAGAREVQVYSAASGTLLLRTHQSSIDLSAYPKGIYLLRAGGKTVKVVKE